MILMDNEFEKEKIGLLKTEMNQLWNAAFITLSGAIAFLLGRDTCLHIILGVLGVFIYSYGVCACLYD